MLHIVASTKIYYYYCCVDGVTENHNSCFWVLDDNLNPKQTDSSEQIKQKT